MYTVAIDESGDFENLGYKKKFAGGIIYYGEDYKEEEQRLKKVFQNSCEILGLRYPDDLHSTKQRRDKLDHITIDKFNKLEEDIIKYMKDSGKYSFIIMIKSRSDRKDINGMSNIVDDKNASNLYEHMVCQLINNIIFKNAVFTDDRKMNINVATRSIGIKDEREKQQYLQLGYNYKYIGDKTVFYLTNQNTFKSAISTKMLDMKIDVPMKIKLKVESIKYIEDSKTSVFLYLADLACDIMRENLSIDSGDFNIKECAGVIKCLIGNDLLCWAYDDIDGIYNELMNNFYHKNYIGCLENIYDIKNMDSCFREIYVKEWINKIEKRLNEIFDIQKIDGYINSAELYFLKDNNNYEKGRYISEKIFSSLENFKGKDKESKINNAKYRLSDILLRAYNHIGDVNKSEFYLKKCESLKNFVTVEQYISTINRAVEIDVNRFDFKSAVKKIENAKLILDEFKENREIAVELVGMSNKRASCYILRGKVLSSLGQFYAFMNQNEKAIEYFKDALAEFDGDETDKNTTISYIMHLAVSEHDLELYKKYEKEYFKSLSLKEQFEYILKNGKSKDYMLYVFVKSINYFYGKDTPSEIISLLQETNYFDKGFNINQHPWELIDKEIAEIYYKKGNKAMGNKWIDAAVCAVKKLDFTIILINICSKIMGSLYNGSFHDTLKEIKGFNIELEKSQVKCEYFEDVYENNKALILKKNPDSTEITKAANDVVNKFTYMYC